MAQISLLCAIAGVRDSVFSVDIDPNGPVDQLKEAIKAANPAMGHCEASALDLYLAKRHGTWLKEDGIKQGLDNTLGLRPLKSTATPLRTSGLSERDVGTQVVEDDGAGRNRAFHVLVEVPPRPLDLGCVTIDVTNSMVVNDPPLVEYWNALRTVSCEVEADAVWALPEGTFFLGDVGCGSRMYIRPCFSQLWDICSKTTDSVSIFGNPGIGKTYFGYLVLLHLARQGETVVYKDADKCLLFSGQVVVQGSEADFHGFLRQPSTWFVKHGSQFKDYKAKTIVITSTPQNRREKQLLSMPVWSEQEIMRCRELLYSNTPVAAVKNCYNRWGGIPRYVLQYAEDPEQQKLLDKAIDEIRVWDLTRICAGLNQIPCSGEDIISDRLFRDRVNDDFTSKGCTFASRYVVKKVLETLMTRDHENVMKFLAGDMAPGLGGAGSGSASSLFSAFLS